MVEEYIMKCRFFSHYLFLIIISLCALNVSSQITWDGGAGSVLWGDAANWNPDGVPGAGDDVSIGSGYSVVVNGTFPCASITFPANASNTLLTINTGAVLTIGGTINFGIPSAADVNQTINVGDGTLICSEIQMPNTNDNSRDNNLFLNDGTLSVSGTIRMSGNGNRNRIEVTGSGTINVGGDFTGGTFISGNSTVNYNGTGDQQIGNYYYYNISVNNGGIKQLINTTLVYGTLTIDNIIDLNNCQLRITTTGSISTSGGYSNSSMLDFQNGGVLRRDGTSTTDYETVYPIGCAGSYSPFGITSLSGTVGGGNLQIICFDLKHPLTSGTNNAITKYWEVSTTNITPTDVQGSFTYTDDDAASPITETNLTMVGRLSDTGWQTNEAGTSYNHATNRIILNGTIPELDGVWTLGESTGCFDDPLPGKYTVNNGYWNAAATWNDGMVPVSSDDVAILHTVTLNTTAGINNLRVTETGSLNLYNNDMTVNGNTTVRGILIDNNNGGTNTFSGSFTVTSTGSFTTNNRSPFIFENGITNNGTFAITNGSAIISFLTNSQIINGSEAPQFNGTLTIGAGLTLTNRVAEASSGLIINGTLNGDNAASQLINETILTVGGTYGPMQTTGLFTASYSGSLVKYESNGTQYITATTYENLTCTSTNWANKYLVSSDTYVNDDFTLEATTDLYPEDFNLTVNDTSFIAGRIYDQNVAGLISFQDVDLSGGQITGSTAGVITIDGDLRVETADGTIGACDITVNGVTTVASGTTMILNSGTGTKVFVDRVTIDGPAGGWNNTGNESIEFRSGLVYNGSVFTSGGGIYSFTTLDQSVSGTSPMTFTGSIIVGNGVTLSNLNTAGITLTGILDGSDAASEFENRNLFVYESGTVPMNTAGILDAASVPNTFRYNRNNTQYIKGTGYSTLELTNAGTKYLAGPVTVSDEFTTEGTANTYCGNYDLTLNSVVTYNSTGTFTAGTNIVTYSRSGDQSVIAGTYGGQLITSGSGVKSMLGDITLTGIINVDGTSTLDISGHTFTTRSNIDIQAGATLEVDAGAQLLIYNTQTLNNSGTLRVQGVSGNIATVSRNGATGGYSIIQSGAGAVFSAQYYEFSYLTGGIQISAGQIDNTGNFSYGSFLNGTGSEYLNITGIDLTGLPDVNQVEFGSGPAYNVTRTSGTGVINFTDASGALAGENYDNDNGNPGTLINWSYPSSVYYSTGNVSAGLTSSWTRNPDGTGGNPSSVTDGLNTLVVQDGHTVVLDNNGDIDVLALQVGEGSSGIFRIGADASQRTAVIRELLDVKSGGSVTAGSSGSPTHILRVYGNINNDGTINLRPSGSDVVNTEIYGTNTIILGTAAPIFNDLIFKTGCSATAAIPIDVNGNIIIEAGSEFDDGGQVHSVAGNWSVTGNGTYTASGTINFDGLVSTVEDNPSAASVSFNNIIFSGGGAGSVQENMNVSGDILVTNNTNVSVANYRINAEGNFTVDPGATYLQSANITDFMGTGAQDIDLSGNVTFYYLYFTNGGATAKTVTGDINASGLVWINDGSTVSGNGNHTINGGLRIDGTCNFSGSVTLTGGSLQTYNASNTLTLGTAELIIDGGVYINFGGSATSLTANVHNNVTIIDGYLVVDNNTQLIGQAGNTFRVETGRTLYCRGADNFPSGFGNYEIEPASLVIYDAAFDQVVRGNITYGNVRLGGASGYTKTADGPMDINGYLDLNDASVFELQNYSHTVTGNIYNNTNSSVSGSSGSLTLDSEDDNQYVESSGTGSYTFNNLGVTLSGATVTRTKTFYSGCDLSLYGGNFSVSNIGGSEAITLIVDLRDNGIGGIPVDLTAGEYCQINTSLADFGALVTDNFSGSISLDANSTVYYSLNGAQTIADGFSYGNITFNGGDKTVRGALDINGSVSRTGGTPVFYDAGFTHTVAGDWLLNNTAYYTAASATGTITLDGINQDVYGVNFNRLVVSNSGVANVVNNLYVYSDLTVNAGAVIDFSTRNLNLGGNFTVLGDGLYTQTSGTITFDGTANQTITSNSLSYLGLFVINKPNAAGLQNVTVLSELHITGNATLTQNAGVLDISGQNVYFGGRLYVEANTVEPGLTFIATGSLTVFDGSDAQYIRNVNVLPLTFNDIEFTGAGDKTIDIAGTGSREMIVEGNFTIDGSVVNASGWGGGGMDIYVRGNWENTGTFLHSNARTVYFDGNDQTISSSGFWNLDIGGTGTKTLLGNISAYSNLTISDAVFDADNHNITVDGNWSNSNPTAAFMPGTGKVVFNGGNAYVYTGAETGPLAGKGFYDVEVNKNAATAYLRGHLDIENTLLLSSGYLVTDTNSIWLAGDFIRTSGDLNQNNNASFLRLDASGGTHIFDPQDENFRGVVVDAPGAVYHTQSDFGIYYVNMIIEDGEFSLNGNKIIVNSNAQSIDLNNGIFNIDSAATVEFNNNNQRINVNGGAFMLVGSPAQPASLVRNTGTFGVDQTAGTLHAYNYIVRNGNITLTGGTIDATHNFSNGTFADGAGTAYLTLTGLDFTDFSVDNVVFNSGPAYNVSRTSGTGVITFQDASGGLAGENYDQDDSDPGTLIEWTFPSGFFWDGGAGTENWHDPDNWSGNVVPTIDDIAYLNHDYIPGAYNIRVMTDNAIAKRVVMDAQGGAVVSLYIENAYDLTLEEHIVIGTGTDVTVSDVNSTIYVGKSWTNQGTFNHGNGTVCFNGPAGNYTIATGGVAAGKSFYNVLIDAEDAIYGLNDPADIDNNLTVNNGTFNLLSGVNDITVGGDWLINQMNGGSFECSTADVTFDGADQGITNGTFYNFNTSGSGTKTLNSNIDINNTVTIGTGTTLEGQTYTLYIGNDWYNDGGFSQTGLGTVIFDGTTGQIVGGGSSITTFNNISFFNNGGKVFYNDSEVEGSFTINGGSGVVNVDVFQVTGISGSNTLTSFGTLEIRGAANFPQGFETVNLASTSNVDYRSDIDQDIYPVEYGNLRLRSLSGAATEKTATGDLVITGSLYMSYDEVTVLDVATYESYITLTGNLAINPGCDIIWGTGNSTLEHVGIDWNIDADLDSLNYLILNGTGNKWMQGDLLIGGDVTVKSNAYLRMYQNNNGALYHRMIGLPAHSFTLENSSRLYNTTPGSVAPAAPEGFSTYNIDDNSIFYLNSGTGVDQTVYTDNSIQYGILYFTNDKIVTSDGIADLDVNGDFDMNNSTYQDNGRNIKAAGANIYLTYYTPSSSSVIVTLDGLGDQYLRDDQENNILLPSIRFTGSGIKTFGDGNDVITIDGDLTVSSGVTATSARNITFNGANWTNNGIYSQTGNTITFNGSSAQTIKSGSSNPSNYFRNLEFSNNSVKTFVTDNADINGNFTINEGTVDLGSLSHTISGQVTNTAGGTLISAATDIEFDGGNQNINTPAFEVNNVTISGTGTKRLFSDWTINGNLLINSGAYLNTSDNVVPTYYDIYIKGNWTNLGTFVDNTASVIFDGAVSPIQITSGGSNFYNVVFNPSASVNYNLQSPDTRIARSMSIGSNASLNLNSERLILGSNLASGKLFTVDGSLTVNRNAVLAFNNQSSQSVMNVGGSLNLVGSSTSEIATVTREVNGVAGSETQINILSGGTLAARYYLIEYLQDAGLNMQPGSILDPVNNFSDGTWSNIRNAANVYYLQLEADFSGGDISNITFNYSGTPVEGMHFNVRRETAPGDITFDVVGGNLGGYQYEDDEEAVPSATTGKLRWPPVTETNWTGAVNTNWHLDGNWDNGIPTSTIDAIIPDRPNDPVISDMDAVCKNLTITDGTLILDNNRNITTTGDVSIGTGTSVGIFSVSTPNSVITAGGNWTRGTYGIFLHGSGTVIFNSGTGTATILPRTSDFNNVVFDNNLTTFYLTGSSINFKGSFQVLSGIVAPSTNNYLYTIEGDIDMSGGTFTPVQGGVTAGTISLAGAGDQQITDGTFYHLNVEGSGIKYLDGSANIDGNTVITSSLYANSGCSVDFNGNVTIENTGTFNDGGETHTFTGVNWTDNGTYDGTGTMIFDRTNSNQNLYRANFHDLIIACIGRRLTLQDDVTISGNLTLLNGTERLDMQYSLITNTTGTGTFTMEDNTRIFVYGADNFPKNFGVYDIAQSSTTYYYGSSDQDIEGVSYGNLYLNNANTKTLTGDVEVKNNLVFNSSTLDVSANNFSLTVGGQWNNNSTGNFICYSGEVIFNGSANQPITFAGVNLNEFYDIRIENTGGYAYANNNTTNDFIIHNNLLVTDGDFHANGRTIYIGGNMLATGLGGFINNTGTYYLNKSTGTAQIGVNGSSLLNLTINSSGGATFTAQDDLALVGDFNLISGNFDGNGMNVSIGNGNTDVANISGDYRIGAGGSLSIGNGTTFTVNTTGSIEIVGSPSSIARVTRNTSGGRYNFIVNGNIAARYYMFEYMTNAGIYLSSTSVIDPVNNFSDGTFTRGANSGQLLRIENTQTYTDPNYIENVSFPINPGGSASNVAKITSLSGDLEFYNATGVFAGEDYDNDPSDLIHWTGPIVLTWNGSVSTDWNDSLNWTASYGPPIVPTGAEDVYIATATNQPILTTYGAKTFNLTINNGASITFNTPGDAGQSDLDIGGDFTINGSIVLLTDDDNVNVEGSWTLGAAATAIINGNVTFDGSGGAKVIDNRTVPFHNLTISGSSQYQLGRNATVNNDLVIDAGATFDVTPSNYSLTVKGNWTGNGTFYSQSGKVTFASVSGDKTLRGGSSDFYDIDINAGVTYTLDGNLSVDRNLNIINGTLDLEGSTLYMGDNSGTDNLTVNGTLIVDDNAVITMGNSSRFNANSGSVIRMVGSDASNSARITGNSGGRYSFDINSGATLYARYYEVEYTDGDGFYVHNGAIVDSVNNMSDGVFSNGYPGSGTYMKLEYEPGRNDTIRNVTFNAGSAFNVSRTTGTSVFFFLDAAGAMGTYEFENDITAPDPGSGLIHWPYLNTYLWTGAIDSDWHKPGNWSGGTVPDITKSAMIPATATNFPVISTADAEAKSITVYDNASLTIVRNVDIAEDLLYIDTVYAMGSPVITIGHAWLSNGGIFIPDNSLVILTAVSGETDIITNGGSFYNLEMDASGAEYNLSANQVILNDITITNGTLDFNGYDLLVGGSFQNSAAFNVRAGTITFNGTSGAHTIDAGGIAFYDLVVNSSTGSASYLLESNTEITNNLTLTRGTLDLSPDGGTTSYDLIIGNRVTNTNGILMGRNGIIEVGENWIFGGGATFTCGTSTVEFVADLGVKTIYPRNNAFYDIVFDGNATFRLSSNLLVSNNLSILNGIFDVGLSPSYSITVGGNWTDNADFLSRSGIVIFNGTNQSLSGTTAESFYNLTLACSEFTLSIDCEVTNTLNLQSGNIITGANLLTLGTGTGNPGTLNYTSGSIIGSFKRWLNAIETNYLFPVGTTSQTNMLTVRFIAGFTAGSLIAGFNETPPGTSGLPLTDGTISVDNTYSEGYWNLAAQNSLAATNYNIRLDAQGFTSYAIDSLTRVLKRNGSSDWTVDGVHVDPSGTVCFRNTLNGISSVSTDFCLGRSICSGGTIGDNDTVCEGTDLDPFINYISPAGGTGYTYTWMETTALTAVPGDANWSALPSSNSLIYDYGVITDTIKVVRRAVATGCPTTYSNEILIEIWINPATGDVMHIREDWAD